ncbi:MAG: RagB/SusD family nutrient uptake outer membrane protein [Gemmatimonadales bacterium]
MLTYAISAAPRAPRSRSGALLSLWLAAVAAGCSGLLDVENPNNISIESLDDPAGAASLANGALAVLTRGWGNIMTPYSEATDELTWIGSRDAWGDLDAGYLSGITNEFVDASFPDVAQARWMADEAIKRLSAFYTAGVLPDDNDLARSYLYGALAYTMIGDIFDDFPISSNRTDAGPPLGPANMAQVYDTAIAYTTRGLAVVNDPDIQLALTAMRARARHGKVVWQKLNPFSAATLANPLVNDAVAVTDANAALALATSLVNADWKFQYTYSSEQIDGSGIGFEVNQRLESRIGDPYIVPTADNKSVASIKLNDPINGTADPVLTAIINEFTTGVQYGPLTVLSARELHLIVAEAALAAGNTAGFTTSINRVRALNAGLTPYDPANPAHPLPPAMLQHERRVNLFLQGRRLNDHYRFGVAADKWPSNAEAVLAPGTLFPITLVEILANCNINPAC